VTAQQAAKHLTHPLSVFLVAAIIAWGLVVWIPQARDQSGPPQLYEGVPFDAHLLELDKRALDEAYHNQLQLLFSIWIKQQATDAKQITNGLQLARKAYNQAAGQIARREQALHDEEQRRTEQPK
jgi:hypothetical protein